MTHFKIETNTDEPLPDLPDDARLVKHKTNPSRGTVITTFVSDTFSYDNDSEATCDCDCDDDSTKRKSPFGDTR
jgi:hypothetical protein